MDGPFEWPFQSLKSGPGLLASAPDRFRPSFSIKTRDGEMGRYWNRFEGVGRFYRARVTFSSLGDVEIIFRWRDEARSLPP